MFSPRNWSRITTEPGADDQLVTPEEVKKGIASFERFVISEALREGIDGQRLTEAETCKRIRSRLVQCTIDKCPMWMPGIALGMMGWLSHEEVHTAMTVSLPGRHFGGILTYPPYYQLRFRYLAFCRKLCEQVLHSLEQSTGGGTGRRSNSKVVLNVQIDREHRSKAEFALFFEELYKLLRAARIAETPSAQSS